jgi:site-specific DNA-adenine methylase
MSLSRSKVCSTKNSEQCERIKKAHKTCGRDYKQILRGKDHKGVLVIMDPPRSPDQTQYKPKAQVSALEIYKQAERFKKASVAVLYSNKPEFKKLFCRSGKYTCHRILKNILNKFEELLAVKKQSTTPSRS